MNQGPEISTQEVNAALTNQPKIIQVDGKDVQIYSHGPRRMVAIDEIVNQVIDLTQQVYVPIETNKTLDNLLEDEKTQLNKIISQFPIEDLSNMVLQYSIKDIRAFKSRQLAQFATLGVKALFLILNPDLENPKCSEDWIWDKIPIQGDDSLGEQIINAYGEKTAAPFVVSVMTIKSLG